MSPSVEVRAVILRPPMQDANKPAELCVRRKHAAGAVGYSLPGGSVKAGEAFKAALTRLVAEQVGIDVQIVGLIDVFDYSGVDPSINIFTTAYLAVPSGPQVLKLRSSTWRKFSHYCGLDWHGDHLNHGPEGPEELGFDY